MTTKKTMTAEKARALLQGTTPGPWDDVRVAAEGDGSARSHEEQWCSSVTEEGALIVTHDGSDEGRANASLARCAPDLVAAVVALGAERDRCLDGVNRLLAAQREDSARLVAERDAALREAVSRHDDARRARQERDEARAEAERLRASLAVARRLVTEDNAALGDALGLSPQDLDQAVEAIRAVRRERDEARAIIEGRTTPPTREECDKHEANGATWLIRVDDYIEYATIVGARISFIALGGQSWPLAEYVGVNPTARWWSVDADKRPCAWPVVGGAR